MTRLLYQQGSGLSLVSHRRRCASNQDSKDRHGDRFGGAQRDHRALALVRPAEPGRAMLKIRLAG